MDQGFLLGYKGSRLWRTMPNCVEQNLSTYMLWRLGDKEPAVAGARAACPLGLGSG
jgi:hypothetical protein